MLFSVTVLLYFFIIQLFANNTKFNVNKYLSYYVFFLSFIILNIFRIYCQSFFPDILNYKSVFKAIQPISFVLNNGYGLEYYESSVEMGGLFETSVEIGFRMLISIYKLFFNDFEFFLFIISTFQLAVFYFFCKRYKINPINAFPIYLSLTYLTFQIGMLRQAIAFCCFLLALVYINRKVVYMLLILLGFTFHKSILICILLIWSDKFINKKLIYVIFLSSLILYLFKIDIINEFLPFIRIEEIIKNGKVDFYMNVDRPNNFLGVGFWERLISFILMNIAYNDLSRKGKINKYNNLIYNLGISVILLQMIFFSAPTITSRLRYYIVIFPIVFLTEYFYIECKNKYKWLFQSLLIVYLFWYLNFQATYLKLN